MSFNHQRDEDELDAIRRKLHNARDLDLEEAQELWYRKNYLEAGRAFGENSDDFGDDQ